ncbi:DUF5634 family protein [Pontibacillus sp. HMF3514]|uniref:DUF5634 family protein n=1 Tax=Pontibacillus sp. HMF3514 TaxID=2692425 RepID=UPI00131FB78C|nr:DUF5634 family protein [Pontibacillus sp. HMF3514]QHE51775.1 hypothetical protein GS400_06865 [Pontibacillus sp. HMF3514]
MDYISVETILNDFKESLSVLIKQYNLAEASIYEEEGEGDTYYIGYTVLKGGKTYHIHMPFEKNDEDHLALAKPEWTIQAENAEYKGFESLDEVFDKINEINE